MIDYALEPSDDVLEHRRPRELPHRPPDRTLYYGPIEGFRPATQPISLIRDGLGLVSLRLPNQMEAALTSVDPVATSIFVEICFLFLSTRGGFSAPFWDRRCRLQLY